MITWHGYDLCEKGFIINLASRPDRRESASKECDIAKIENIDFFNATVVTEEHYGPYGCTQSHLDLYKYQVDNNIQYMLILEDDIETIYSYTTSDNLCISDEQKQNKYVKNLISSFLTIKPDILWLGTRIENTVDYYDNYISYSNNTLTSHAYICSYNFAKFALNNLRYKDSNHFSFGWPIDHFLSQVKVKSCGQLLNNPNNQEFLKNNLITTVSNCLIFNQKASYSDIINRDADYTEWILGCHEEYCFKPISKKINYYEYI